MKYVQKFALIFATLLFTVSGFAAVKSSVNLTLYNKAVVNGTTLTPGQYKVEFDRTGNNVQTRFVENGKTMADANGHFEQRSTFPSSVALVTNDKDNSIQQIQVQKMKGAVVFDNGSSTMPSTTGGSH